LLAQPLRSARALFRELANARNAEAFDRAIDIRIMRLRRKIEPDPAHPTVIRIAAAGIRLRRPPRRRRGRSLG
jgi:two-component system, OmpR family, response regulator